MKTDSIPRPSGSPETHARLLAAAIDATGEASPTRLILRMVEDAARVLEDGVDHERNWLAKGRHSNWRLPAALSRSEARMVEKLRVLAGLSMGDTNRPMRSDRGETDAQIVLEWLRWTHDDRRGPDLFRAASEIAKGDRKHRALAIWRPGRPHDRQELWRLRQRIADRILTGLKRQGIDLRAWLAPAEPLAA